jgi:hypothetical protein
VAVVSPGAIRRFGYFPSVLDTVTVRYFRRGSWYATISLVPLGYAERFSLSVSTVYSLLLT